jgi:hypothetical protein
MSNRYLFMMQHSSVQVEIGAGWHCGRGFIGQATIARSSSSRQHLESGKTATVDTA